MEKKSSSGEITQKTETNEAKTRAKIMARETKSILYMKIEKSIDQNTDNREVTWKSPNDKVTLERFHFGGKKELKPKDKFAWKLHSRELKKGMHLELSKITEYLKLDRHTSIQKLGRPVKK